MITGSLAAVAPSRRRARAGRRASPSACGDSNEDSGGSGAANTSADAELAAMVPRRDQERGQIVVGTDASYPPNETSTPARRRSSAGTSSSATPSRPSSVLRTEYHNAGFDTIIPGIAVRQVRDRRLLVHRQQGAREGSRLRSPTSPPARRGPPPPGNPKGVDPDDACGKSIGVAAGHGPGRRPHGQEQEVHRPRASRRSKQVVRTAADRGEQRPGRRRPTPWRPTPPIIGVRHQEDRQAGDRRRGLRHRARTATRSARTPASSQDAVLGAVKALIDRRHLREDPEGVAAWSSGAITDPAINAAQS